MARVYKTVDHKIGQIGSSLTPSTINAELDLIHDRINTSIERGDRFIRRVTTDADYQVLPDDSYVGVDSAIRVIAIKLPNIEEVIPNRVLTIKDEGNNAATKNIVIYPFGSETIDKAATLTISTNLGVKHLICTGEEWFTL